MKTRGLDRRFLDAMREKLSHGRERGYVGWDEHWKCRFASPPMGPNGLLFTRLREEVTELSTALHGEDKELIRKEAADVANFAMFIADIHGALDDDH